MKTLLNILLLLVSIVTILNGQNLNNSNVSERLYNSEYDNIISTLWPAFQDTSQRLHIPTAREVSSPLGLPARMLMNNFIRDAYICKGPDDIFYLIGTSGGADVWKDNDGISIWKSVDLINWKPLGFVWSFDKDATWSKKFLVSPFFGKNSKPVRAVWAPELHFLKGTYWICYSMNYTGIGILKSTSGKVEGPYMDVKKDGPIADMIDPSLYQDDDGAVYLLWSGDKYARLKDDLSDLAEKPREFNMEQKTWCEGSSMYKINGKYILDIATVNPKNYAEAKLPESYDCEVLISDSINGTYKNRHIAVPYGGHNNFFQDNNGHWWSTIFGSGSKVPWAQRPGIVPIDISPNGYVAQSKIFPYKPWRFTTVNPADSLWNTENFDDKFWDIGSGGIGYESQNTPVAVIGTYIKTDSLWCRRSFFVRRPILDSFKLLVYNRGNAQIYLNGEEVSKVKESVSNYKIIPVRKAYIHKGENLLSVFIIKDNEPVYIDIGIIEGKLPNIVLQ